MEPETQESKPQAGSNISNVQWGLLIGGAIALDLFQFLLDWILIGEFVNPVIDFIVGPLLAGFFLKRGVSANGKKIFAWIAAPVWEILTDGFLPIGWIVEVVITMIMDKADKVLDVVPESVQNTALSKMSKRSVELGPVIQHNTQQDIANKNKKAA